MTIDFLFKDQWSRLFKEYLSLANPKLTKFFVKSFVQKLKIAIYHNVYLRQVLLEHKVILDQLFKVLFKEYLTYTYFNLRENAF